MRWIPETRVVEIEGEDGTIRRHTAVEARRRARTAAERDLLAMAFAHPWAWCGTNRQVGKEPGRES